MQTKTDTITAATVIDSIRVWDADSAERARIQEQLEAQTNIVAKGFDKVLRGIVEAVESGVADKSGRKLSRAAKEQGLTLFTNGGLAPSDKWFDRHHAIGVFFVAVDDQITADDAVELTAGLGHGEGKVTPAALRGAVDDAVTNGKDVLRAVAALFAARAEVDEDEGDDEGTGDGADDDTKAPTTDADLVDAIANILKGWQGDGTATVDDLLAVVAVVS